MAQQSRQKSEILDFRSMAVARDNSKRILTQVKAVDAAYPLVGEIVLSNGMSLPEALAGQNDLPGAVVAPALMRRLQLNLCISSEKNPTIAVEAGLNSSA